MIDTTLQSLTQKPDLGPVTNERGRVWASFRLILIFHSLCFFLSRLFSIVSSSSHFGDHRIVLKEGIPVLLVHVIWKTTASIFQLFYKSAAKYSNTIFDFWISCLTLTRFHFFLHKNVLFSLSAFGCLSLSLSRSWLMIVCSQVDLPCLALHAKRCLKLPSTLRTHSFLHTQ